LTPKATVCRDGQWKVIDAAELVPGDIIRIKLGDVAPADLKLLQSENIKADQSGMYTNRTQRDRRRTREENGFLSLFLFFYLQENERIHNESLSNDVLNSTDW
jgi:hypothetical protein